MRINDVEFNCTIDDILDRLEAFQDRKDSGDNIMVHCPYHNDRRPSAGIRKSDGLFHCFGCQETHSLPEVISHLFNADDIGAYGWKWLLKNFLTISVEERNDIPLDLERNTLYNVSESKEYVSEEELDSYRYTHPYWTKRGIVDENIIELFDLGYSKTEQMITMPNYDKDGNCVFVAKRSVKTKFFSYPNNASKCCYGIYQLYNLKEFPKTVWITESMIDTLRLWQLGIYSIALNGLGNHRQIKELNEMPCREFVIATDMDIAGKNAREKLKLQLNHKLLQTVELPNNRKDIGECTDEEILNLQIFFA